MAAQHGEQDQDRRSDPRGLTLPQRRAPTVPLGSAARGIDEDEGEPWAGRGFSFTRSAARRRLRGDDGAERDPRPERRRSARS